MKQIHLINDTKFKGIYISLNYILDIPREDISKYAVLASILSKSSRRYKNQTEIEKYLFNLYGSSFDVSVQKLGDLYQLEFSMEFVNKEFLPEKKDMLIPCLNFLREVVYHPIFEDKELDDNFFELEKENMLQKVKSKKDDKMYYAVSQTENFMAKDTLFGGYLYGEEEQIQKLTKEDIIQAYQKLIHEFHLQILVSGNLDGYDQMENQIKEVLKEYMGQKGNLEKLCPNKPNQKIELEEKYEFLESNQSVLTFGLRVKEAKVDDFYKMMLYNTILGGTPSSKLFQNVREKESLAYTVRSRYYRFKNLIMIYAGIDKNKEKKAKEVMKRELEEMKQNITQEEFHSAKESILSDLQEWNDSKIAIAKMKLSNMLSFQRDSETLETMYDKLKMVTLEEVKEIANRVYISKIYLLGGKSDE